MPYRLLNGEPIQDGIRRVIGEQIGRALGELADPNLDQAFTIHQVRRRCKKIRAALRLVGSAVDTYAQEDAWYRDAARRISEVRDTDAMIGTCDALVQGLADQTDLDAVTPIRNRLAARRDALMVDPGRVGTRLQACGLALLAGQHRVASLDIDGAGHAVALAGLCTTYAAARTAMAAARAHPTAESFHEWRKRVKHHACHLRLLRGAWPRVVRARWKEAEKLGELLGAHHDLGVLRAWAWGDRALVARKSVLEHFTRLIDQRTELVERACWPLGWRLFAEKPKHLRRRFAAYFKAWSQDG
jgi:CHAD domain-containing protein